MLGSLRFMMPTVLNEPPSKFKAGFPDSFEDGKVVDRFKDQNAWIVKREAELKSPGGLERKEDPALSAVIDRYIAESKNAVLGTKAQVLKSIKNSDLGETKCSDITSRTLVSFARGRIVVI